jgi:hypothetical protein
MPLHRPSNAYDFLVQEVAEDRVTGHDLAIAVLAIENHGFIRRLERQHRKDKLAGNLRYIIACAMIVGAFVVVDRVRDLAHDNGRLIQGQANAALARCAATSAVIAAGRETIVSSTVGPGDPRTEAALERLGFPSRADRRRQAKAAARDYADSIARNVKKETGEKLLVKRDGTLDCSRLAPNAQKKKKERRRP